MDSKRIKLSPSDAECDSKVISVVLTSTPSASTSKRILFADDESFGESDDNVSDSGIDVDVIGIKPVDWKSVIDLAKSVYKSSTITSILEFCYRNAFTENPDSSRCSESSPEKRSQLRGEGTIIHKYIAEFYKTFSRANVKMADDTDEFIGRMLVELKKQPTELISSDIIANRPNSDPKFRTIHLDLLQELLQFYKFANDLKLIVHEVEGDIVDKNHLVYGRYNALFRMNDSDELMLYDWTRSPIMYPGSLSLQRKTLQLNMYKYILEKSAGVKIAKMYSLILHYQSENYEIIEIEDIDFRCDCPKCNDQNTGADTRIN